MKNYIIVLSLVTSAIYGSEGTLPDYVAFTSTKTVRLDVAKPKDLGDLLASAASAIEHTDTAWEEAQENGSHFVYPQSNPASQVGLILYPYQLAGKKTFLKSGVNSFLNLLRIGIAVPASLTPVRGSEAVNAIVLGHRPQFVCHNDTKRAAMILGAAAVGYSVWSKLSR